MRDVKIDIVGQRLRNQKLVRLTYWSVDSLGSKKKTRSGDLTVHLLPNYDELMNALRDRSLSLDPSGPPPPAALSGSPTSW